MALLLLSLLCLSTALATSPSPSPAPSTPTQTDPSTDFIRTSCAATLYPSLCFNSLSPYSDAIQQNPTRLAIVAVSLALSRARSLSSHLRNLSLPFDPSSASALRDCRSVISDAVDQLRKSESELRKVGSETEEDDVAWEMSNVKTWMSAALTNEDTCVDGFAAAPEGEVKKDVTVRVVKVKKMTSVALSLVNSLADKIVPGR
ncbi:hypothetical protein QJS04_geneDACA017154 [Acorus gramineus]|uniref:Pectinesterase inhibitor domain-containing protein n=1 Tax=Acorus gramineus TaxID=55184 RepID=A0AAV9BPZ8_ACOGR|nr:hypothetical protein QJS04_geneDACA017154 [Acorus gramineus]